MKKIFLLMLILLISISFVFANVDGAENDNSGTEDDDADDGPDDNGSDEDKQENSDGSENGGDEGVSNNDDESKDDEEQFENDQDSEEDTYDDYDDKEEYDANNYEEDQDEQESNYEEYYDETEDDYQCPSEDELDQKKDECANDGVDYDVDYHDGCDFIVCLYDESDKEEYDANNYEEDQDEQESNYEEYYDETEDDYQCPSEDELDQKKDECANDGVDYDVKYDGKCDYVVCLYDESDKEEYDANNYEEDDYHEDFYCPSEDEFNEMLSSCKNDGFEYEIDHHDGCDFVICHAENHFEKYTEQYGEEWCKDGNCCPDNICDEFEQRTRGCNIDCNWEEEQICMSEEEFQEKSDECNAEGMIPVTKGDDNCQWIACNFDYEKQGYQEGMCPTQEDMTKHKEECEGMGLNAYTGIDHGCAVIYCDGGHEGLEYKDDWKVPSSVEMLSFVLKIEGIKIKLDSVKEKISGINNYYVDSDNTEKATNYANALDEIEIVQQDLDSIIEKIKTIAAEEEIDYNQFVEVKHALKDVIDNGVHDILAEVLGI